MKYSKIILWWKWPEIFTSSILVNDNLKPYILIQKHTQGRFCHRNLGSNWCHCAFPAKFICPNSKIYIFKLLNIFVQIVRCICPNCEMYLSKLQDVFVQTLRYLGFESMPLNRPCFRSASSSSGFNFYKSLFRFFFVLFFPPKFSFFFLVFAFHQFVSRTTSAVLLHSSQEWQLAWNAKIRRRKISPAPLPENWSELIHINLSWGVLGPLKE